MGLEGNQRNDSMKHKFTGKSPRAPSKGAEGVLGKPSLQDYLVIRIDSREQTPLSFNEEYVKCGVGTIDCFDYCLEQEGKEGWAIERKSRDDLIQSVALSASWKRELAKIAKAQEKLLPIIYLCEFAEEDLYTYDYTKFRSGKVSSQFICRRIGELMFNYNVHVFFAGSREAASYWICVLLKRRFESLKEALKI